MRRRFLFPCAALAAAILWANVLLATTTAKSQKPDNAGSGSPVADATGVPPSILVLSRAMGSTLGPPEAPRWTDRLLVTQTKQVFDYDIQLVSTHVGEDDGVSGAVADRTLKYGSLPQISEHLVFPYTSGPPGVSHRNDTAHWRGHLENITAYSLTGEFLGTSNVATFKLDRLRTGNYFVYTSQIGVFDEITYNTPEILDLSGEAAAAKIAEWSDPHFIFNGNGNFNHVELLSAQEYIATSETTTVPQTAREGAQAWNTQNLFQNNFDSFQGNEPAVAYLQSPTATSKTFRKVQYKFVLTPASPPVINWLEIFTPKDPAQPKSYVFQSWTPATGQTESLPYTIDPLAIDPTDANAAQRQPTVDGTWTVDLNIGSLAVDANRDGEIKLASEDASDATAPAQSYGRWLNDDIDWQHTVDGNDSEEDDLQTSPNGKVDWENNYIPSKRDLEDFARIQVSVAGLLDALKPKSNGSADLYLGLKWASATGTPAIKLYQHVETDGGLKYLTDEATANQQINTAYCLADVRDPATQPQNATSVLVEVSDVFILPPSLFSALSTNDPKAYLLFEGCKPGKGQLKVVLLKKEGENYNEIGEGPGVWMDLKMIGDMYEHWSVGNASGGEPDPAGAVRISSFTGSPAVFKYDNGSPSPEERKYILFVHGWNMERWEKERYAETAYKRLWWQGYKGRVGLFSWPTTNGFEGDFTHAAADGTNYDRGEWAAWKSATPLRALLQTLHGPGAYGDQVYVLAHSMGNVVTGEALRLASQQGAGRLVNTYVASQAALPVQVYDGGSTNLLDAIAPFDIDASTIDQFPETPNSVYPDWLAGNGAAAGTRINFYNVNDFALWRDAWQLNQYTKPDHKDQPDQPWDYRYLQNMTYPDGQFQKTKSIPLATVELALGGQARVQDRYEVMAFAAESYSKALGATPSDATLTRSVDLTLPDNGIWLGDPDPSTDNRPYARHKWHSAQFRSTNMLQKGYWRTLLGPQGFNLGTTQ
jgi:hypothetical protein